MKSRERVKEAFHFGQPDCTPCDYFATPEIHQSLLKHFGVREDDELRECLGTDIRVVNPPYIGPKLPTYPDGSVMNIWGIVRKPMPNEYGDYLEPVNYPYAKWKTVREAETFSWPSPDWYDYGLIPELCQRHPDKALMTGEFAVQDFINGTAFGRGVEQVLLDIALEDPVFLYIVEKRHRFYMEYVERTLRAAKGRIDIVLCGDDFGTQRGLLIGPERFEKIFAAKKQEFFDMVHGYGARVSHHCCGSSRDLIPRFITLGMDALQTIQPQASGMNPYELKELFHGKIVFHGAVDVQGWLQRASTEEVSAEIDRLMDVVGKGGGLVIAPCHHIQPDVPLRNVLAFYRTVALRKNEKIHPLLLTRPVDADDT
jgi:uroporphyrinogen decarboxylase